MPEQMSQSGLPQTSHQSERSKFTVSPHSPQGEGAVGGIAPGNAAGQAAAQPEVEIQGAFVLCLQDGILIVLLPNGK